MNKSKKKKNQIAEGGMDKRLESMSLNRQEPFSLNLKDLQIKLTEVKFGRSPVYK